MCVCVCRYALCENQNELVHAGMSSCLLLTHVHGCTACVPVPTCMCTRAHVHVYPRPRACVPAPTCMCTRTHVHVYPHPRACVPAPTCMCTRAHVHVYPRPHARSIYDDDQQIAERLKERAGDKPQNP